MSTFRLSNTKQKYWFDFFPERKDGGTLLRLEWLVSYLWKVGNAALCPYLQCLLDCRKWCFFSWSMVALLGSSDLCLLSVCLPFRLPCWWRWTMSGRYSQSGISMLWSGSCNDGDPRAKVTKRSKQPIYTHVNVGQFYLKSTSKTWFSEQDPSTPIVYCH